MRRPPLRSPSTYERLMLAIREEIDTGGDVPCLRPDSKPEWWFSDDEREIYRAKERCRVCPVQRLCDRHARTEEEHGVWAGRTRAERNLPIINCTVVMVVSAS